MPLLLFMCNTVIKKKQIVYKIRKIKQKIFIVCFRQNHIIDFDLIQTTMERS